MKKQPMTMQMQPMKSKFPKASMPAVIQPRKPRMTVAHKARHVVNSPKAAVIPSLPIAPLY